MRIDKYLKLSRIIKRRTIAQEACEQGRVSINDKVVKPSAEVKVGDVIEIRFGQQPMRYQVLDIKEHVKKEDTNNLYQIL